MSLIGLHHLYSAKLFLLTTPAMLSGMGNAFASSNSFSSLSDRLGDHLVNYVRNELPPFVRLVRTPSRLGLIKARLFGAERAKGTYVLEYGLLTGNPCHFSGKILVFLDSHIEANVGWLPPLLDPIRKDRKTSVAPIIDNIEKSNMVYSGHMSPYEVVGIFNWGLEFKWGPAHNRPTDLSEPFEFVDSEKSSIVAFKFLAVLRPWLVGYLPSRRISSTKSGATTNLWLDFNLQVKNLNQYIH